MKRIPNIMLSAFRNTCTTLCSHHFLNPKPYFPLFLISTQNISLPNSTSLSKPRYWHSTFFSMTSGADSPNPSSEKLEKQFEDFRVRLEESGNLKERIRAVATEIDSVTRLIYASLLLVHQSRPVAGIHKFTTPFGLIYYSVFGMYDGIVAVVTFTFLKFPTHYTTYIFFFF